MGWAPQEISILERAESVRLEAGPAGSVPLGSVEIGIVTVGDVAFVRAYRGSQSAWYQAIHTYGRGFIHAEGLDRAVTFYSADPLLADAIDAAFRAKYGHHGPHAIALATSAVARHATVAITPESV